MTIAVEAGLGFESAMMRAAKNGTGPFAQELIRTLQDMQVGQSRKEAYLALADRTTVVELRRFLRAVIQADEYGIAVADVLRTQASEMRLKRRQRAEEKADEDSRQGDLPVDAVHSARTVHRAARAGRRWT